MSLETRHAILDALLTVLDDEYAEVQYASLVAAWNKAGETARQRFRELIDTPVMDRSAA